MSVAHQWFLMPLPPLALADTPICPSLGALKTSLAPFDLPFCPLVPATSDMRGALAEAGPSDTLRPALIGALVVGLDAATQPFAKPVSSAPPLSSADSAGAEVLEVAGSVTGTNRSARMLDVLVALESKCVDVHKPPTLQSFTLAIT